MKKLMIALASVATAFGLYAADEGFVSGAGFDTSDTTGYTWLKDGGFVSGYWANTEKASIVAEEYTYGGEHPAQFAGDKDRAYDQYLKIEATPFGATPVKVSIKQSDDGQRLGNGFYYDSLVNFTACDEDPAFDAAGYADAKIFVYPKQNDQDDESKGVNYYVAALGADGVTAYKTSKTFAEGWHRVTVKMIKSVLKGQDTDVGFVVFIDGKALGCMDAQAAFTSVEQAALTPAAKKWFTNGQLFRSLAKDTDEVKGVAYDGKGSVDEIAFTTTAPEFAVDAQFFQVGWDNESIESVSVNGTELTSNPQDVEYEPGSTYTFVAKDGFVSVDEDTDFEDLKPNKDYTLSADPAAASYTIGGVTKYVKYLAEALDAVNDASENATLKLGADAGAITINNANADVEITLDLAGKTVVAETETDSIAVKAGALKIIDSDGTGKVNIISSDYCALTVDEGTFVTIEAGEFNGSVMFTDTAPDGALINGGSFLVGEDAFNDKETLDAYAKEGFEFTQAEGSDYLELTEKQDEPFSGGTGAIDDPYQISEYKDLVELQEKVAAGDTFEKTYFQQTDDIALEAAWKCIGSSTIPFKGNYDGQNYTISNLRFAVDGDTTNGAYTYLGFFRYVYGGAIENLKIEMAENAGKIVNGFDLTNQGDVTEWGGAAFVGQAMTNAVLRNLTAVSGTIAGSHNVGGIAVKAFPSVQILDCTNFVNLVAGYTKAAGIVVFSQKDSLPVGTEEEMTLTISGCRNVGTITATDWVTIKDSKPNKWSGQDGLAGIIDYIGDDVIVAIENCSSEGAIDVTAQANKVPVGSIAAYARCAGLKDLGGNTTTLVDIPSAVDHASKATTIDDGSFIYAVVDSGVATFVKPALDLTGAITYKVMAPNEETVTLTVGQSIKFDEAIAAVTVVPDDAEKNKVEKSEPAGTVYTYTCAALPPPGPTPVDDGKVEPDPEDPTGKTFVVTPADGKDSIEITGADSSMTIKVTSAADFTITGLNGAAVKVVAGGQEITAYVKGGDPYSTALDDVKVKAVVDDREGVETPFAIGETSDVTIKAIPGLTYTLKVASAVDGDYGTAAGDEAVKTAGAADTTITLKDATPPEGAGFYKINIAK